MIEGVIAIGGLLVGLVALAIVGAPEVVANVGILKFTGMPVDNFSPDLVTQFFTPNHNGVDFGVSIGTPLLNVAPGTVVQIQRDPNNDSGMFVIVRGRLPYDPLIAWGYAHMSRIDVSVGQDLDAGDVVGLSGNTGLTSSIKGDAPGTPQLNRTDGLGAHLHFTTLDVARGFASLNPEPFLPEPLR